ncbi:unnamed protein product [Hymenolepis diminuta]|uniref:Uncharacterized protein n=1 Tax=Hymenolepis diminuta TaxID=6216 RepID=A0A564YU79_HYMDI|nr:unnamed protein product [Hymenolepis diminuta]
MKVFVLLSLPELIYRPPWSSPRNILVSVATFELNPCSLAILSDRLWWMIKAGSKLVLLNLFHSRETVLKVVAQNADEAALPYHEDHMRSHINPSLAGPIQAIPYLILVDSYSEWP